MHFKWTDEDLLSHFVENVRMRRNQYEETYLHGACFSLLRWNTFVPVCLR